jgi:endonuclease III
MNLPQVEVEDLIKQAGVSSRTAKKLRNAATQLTGTSSGEKEKPRRLRGFGAPAPIRNKIPQL